MIQRGEELGFKESLINVRGKGEVMDKEIRDNDRVVFDDKELADKMWERIKEFVPQIDGFDPLGLNERFRYYRYQGGQQFKPHVDGSVKLSETDISFITVLMYLNEDFTGGETTFIIENESIKPETGMLLLFTHKQLHSGRPVPDGVKYVLRTDVMYRLKS